MIARFFQDTRFALRTFRRTPGFTVIAVITIALGLAANVTVFSYANAMFLRDLPVKDAARLVRVYGTNRNRDDRYFSYSQYAYLRDHATTMDQMVTHYSTAPLYVNVNDQTGELQGAVVSANYFPTFGVTPYLGRFFTPQEDSVPDRDAVAVIGYGLWRSWFGADPAVLGKTMRINGKSFQVVGVAPKGFQGVELGLMPNQLWIPTMMLRVGYRGCDSIVDGCTPLSIIGRLAPGKTVQQAGAEMAALVGQYAAARPGVNVSQGAWATPAIGIRLTSQRENLLVARLLSAAAIALLLIACLNLASLLIARGTARTKEIALRLSLGAARSRILQQLLTECVLLAAMGGTLGLLLSLWTSQLLIGLYTVDSEGYRRYFNMSIDPRTLLYAVGLSLFTGILFGILPAIQAARQDTTPALKQGTGSGSSHRGRNVLVTCQVALSLAMLVAAGLLARSVENIETGQTFRPQHVELLRLRPLLVGYEPNRSQAFQREALRRLESVPGVVSASLTSGTGFVWTAGETLRVSLPGQQPAAKDRAQTVQGQEIAPRYFATLGIPFVQGRDFDDRDRAGSPRVAIVNESLASQLWPGASAVDRMVALENQDYRVVGVVKDAQVRNVIAPTMAMAFIPYFQNNNYAQVDSRLCIRVAGDPDAALGRLKAAIASVDPNVPITETLSMITQVRGNFTNVRLARSVLLSAGGLGLLLSAIGLYGVLAFVVGRRTREIGIRMAIGARPREVMRLFLKQGFTLAVFGCVAGLVLALVTTRLLGTFLYGVPARDPISFAIGAVVLFMVAMAATYLPARRASLVDPMAALREE